MPAVETLTREQLHDLFNHKPMTAEEAAKLPPDRREQHQQFSMMIQDLRYPVTKEGDVASLDYIAALVAYHLVRCGWRQDPDKRVIKPRKVAGRGVPTGAVEWVSMDEPDDPLADIGNMTMKQVAELTPQARAEAIRRLAPNMHSDLPEPDAGWSLKPNITIADVPPEPFAN